VGSGEAEVVISSFYSMPYSLVESSLNTSEPHQKRQKPPKWLLC
jgi:hypothetical protein